MKYLLLLIIVLFAMPFLSNGQFQVPSYPYREPETHPIGTLDTVKVIMLICDSSMQTKSQYGYNVMEWIADRWINDIHFGPMWESRYYLDDRKLRLSNVIIIWQVMTLK